MIIKKTKFKDLLIIKQKNNIDKRGILRETFNKNCLERNLFLNIAQLQKIMFSGVFIFRPRIFNQSM